MAAKKKARRKKAAPDSRGLAPKQTREEAPPQDFAALEARITGAGGELIGHYRDPLGGQWLALAALPVACRRADALPARPLRRARRSASTDVIERVGVLPRSGDRGRVAGRAASAPFWTPNGNHRLTALRKLGARTVTALVSADPAIAYRILALNTEKAHNTKEKSLEAVRMARGLAEVDAEAPRERVRARARGRLAGDARPRLRGAAALRRRRLRAGAARQRRVPRRAARRRALERAERAQNAARDRRARRRDRRRRCRSAASRAPTCATSWWRASAPSARPASRRPRPTRCSTTWRRRRRSSTSPR